ncbi:MAG TPA: hypothetical protein VGG32_10945 [Thermoplasmata archaeon]
MTEVRIDRAPLLLPLAVDSVLLVGLLLATVGHSGGPVTPEFLANTTPHSSANASGADLIVDPPSYGMRTGSNLTLQSVWSAGSPLCHVAPLWYRWSVGRGNATGFLNATTSPSATFTADSFGSGTVAVTVRSGAVLDCGANETVFERTSGANVSIVVPLSLSGVELGPNPLLPGDNAILEGTVSGGEPPYTLDVTWGDGTHSTVALPASGPFSVDHRFSAGNFVPSVIAADAGGSFVNVSVAEALSVGTGLEVAITPSSYVAEVGVPVEFTGIVQGESAGTVTLFDCSNATVGPTAASPAIPNETAFSCTFTAPGTAVVLFGAYPPQPGGPSASVVLYEHVVAPPQVWVDPVAPVGEVGSTALVQVHLSGGVLPISLTWNLSGNQSGGTETVGSDGGGVLALPLGTAGEYVIGVRASDALGAIDTNGTATVRVEPPLVANASGARSIVSYGAVAEVGGDVLSGCPPFSWWVVPNLTPANGSAGNGTLPNVGAFAWSGSYAREGNLSVAAGVADGCDATWQTGLVVPLVPPLSVEVAAGPGPSSPNETLAVNLSIQGGQPPLQLGVNASDNESWNRTVPSDGTYRWLFPTHGNGSLGIAVSVTDLLGGSAGTDLTVVLVRPPGPTVPPPTPSPPPSVGSGPSGNSTGPSTIDPTWFLAVLIPAGGAGAMMLLVRRRAREARREVPGPDPVATLKRIIEPAEGAERFTVELLAEEAGVPLAVVRSTIDRLVSEGTVCSESGADGEEVLSWSSDAGR